MSYFTTRRALLLALAAAPFAGATEAPESALAQLEKNSGGRLGVAAIDTANGRALLHRAEERFPLCSTFKMMASAAILARGPALLDKRVRYAQSDLVTYSPVTGKHVEQGMTLAELCAAALQYSDNTAGNLLLKELGGPAALTAYARSIGDQEFSLERWETELNTAIPGDLRDTTTPLAMAQSLQKLLLGDALPPAQRERLQHWMLGNTTGATRIRAGLPSDWPVADKTGAGDYGTVNDIAVIWPPGHAPIVLAVYLTQPGKDDKLRPEIHGQVAEIVLDAFGMKKVVSR